MGKCEEAVQESHRALATNQNDYQVLEDMIDIHKQAAQKDQSLEGYVDAIRWLNCALTHDRSNTEVLDCIADRHFLSARQLYEREKYIAALQAVKDCLEVNRGHLEALEFKKILIKQVHFQEQKSSKHI